MRGRTFVFGYLEAVADPAHGLDITWLRWVALDLFAEPPDMHIHGATVAGEVKPPDALKQQIAGERNAVIAHQACEQIELFLGEVHLAAVAPCPAAAGVNLERSSLQDCTPDGMRLKFAAPQDRPHSGEEFTKTEGFPEIVVRTEFEASDLPHRGGR